MGEFIRAAVLAVAVGAGMTVGGTGPVAADPTGATLRYTCTVASFPSQSVTARLTWTVPDSVVVGRPTPALPVEVTSTLSAMVTDGAAMFGVAAVEGTVDATGVVSAPEGDTRVGVPLTVPRTDVPESGPMTVTATGTIPGHVFHRPGHATVTIGDALHVGVDLKDADGDPMGKHLDASCVLEPDQNTILASFEITPAEQPSAPSAAQPAGPPGSRTHPTATRGPSASAAVPVGAPGSDPDVPGSAHLMPGSGPRHAVTRTVSPTAAVVVTGRTAAWWLLVGTVLAVVAGLSWWLVRRRRDNPRW